MEDSLVTITVFSLFKRIKVNEIEYFQCPCGAANTTAKAAGDHARRGKCSALQGRHLDKPGQSKSL